MSLASLIFVVFTYLVSICPWTSFTCFWSKIRASHRRREIPCRRSSAGPKSSVPVFFQLCLGTYSAASPASLHEHFLILSNTLQNRLVVPESVWLVAAPHLPKGRTRLYALLLPAGTVVRFSRFKNRHLVGVEVVRNW